MFKTWFEGISTRLSFCGTTKRNLIFIIVLKNIQSALEKFDTIHLNKGIDTKMKNHVTGVITEWQ